MIWIIGGTSEAAELVKAVQGKLKIIVSVATETGKDFLPECQVRVGPMNTEEMVDFIKQNDITTIIDATHPYAVEASQNAKLAQEKTGIEYIRYSRPKTELQDVTFVNSITECLEFLKTVSGCVFFTTGSNQINQFESVRRNNRFIYRVLPTPESTGECRKNEVALKDIIAALGPFSEELNQVMFKSYEADFVIMKNSGQRGGTEEKIKACKQLGITPVVIERDDETGFTDIDRLVEYLLAIETEKE